MFDKLPNKIRSKLKQTTSGVVIQSLSASKLCGVCKWDVTIILPKKKGKYFLAMYN